MAVGGHGRRGVMLIGEAPGGTEDAKGTQFVGQAGATLKHYLRTFARIDLFEDLWLLNAVNCRPVSDKGTNKKPTRTQINCCRPYVFQQIRELGPTHIILAGSQAIESFYGDRFHRLGITRWRGMCLPDKLGWVLPIFHPSFVMRQDRDQNLQSLYGRDMRQLGTYLKRRPFKPIEEDIQVLYDPDDIVHVLKWFNDNAESLFFDYETTGLKPFRPGHKIVAVSISNGSFAYSFPLDFKDILSDRDLKRVKEHWKNLIQNPRIPKYAHNLKFEDVWTRTILGVEVANWDWCSMNAAHIIDNRSGITGLKFQTYCKFGVDPYDADIKKYLESPNSNGFNNVEDAPLDKMLLYCGRDSFYGHLLVNWQKDHMTKGRMKAYRELFHDGLQALADVQINGICINEQYYHDQEKKLDADIESTKKNLLNMRDAKRFRNEAGKELNLASNKDLSRLFYKIMKLEATYSDKGNPKVDKETIDNLIHFTPDKYISRKTFMTHLLRLRKIEKIRNTYLEQFGREAFGGKLHPFFDLHIPVSFRGSCSNPNFQNIPKRDEDAKRICRSGVFPSPGNQLMEADYSGIEVCISACYHKDPNMIAHISNPENDMHRDAGMDIWMLDKEQITKKIRFFAKNCWVFPQFYGSYYSECLGPLIKNCIELETNDGITLKEHISNQQIDGIDMFEAHLRDVQEKFWDRFRVYAEWKKEVNLFYRKHGYIETFFGFRCGNYMSDREASNYAIQGSAFHCLLWTLIRINRYIRDNQLKSKIIGQIHDSIIFDLYPPEREEIIEALTYIGTKQIRERFDWIIVPLEIEYDIAPIDKSWYDLEEMKVEKEAA